ncbi:MAG: hypothetical protein P8Y64_08190 [Gammaproteobacteria bacterium]|jgi:hypothetical protein
MNGPGLRIVAAGGAAFAAGEEALALNPLLKAAGLKPPRRTTRLIQLALLGAQHAMSQTHAPLAPNASVYLATGQGSVADTAALMEGMLRQHQPPMPFTFINVSSNLAGFHIAGQYGLNGPNLTVSRHDFCFESALQLALLDAAAGRLSQGLIGGVDECVWPLAEHRRRLHQPDDAALGEGSHWLVADQTAAAPLAVIKDVKQFADRTGLLEFAGGLPKATRVTGAKRMDAVLADIADSAGLAQVAGVDDVGGYYDTLAAAHLVAVLQRGPGPWLYVSGGRGGCWTAVLGRNGA